MRNDDEELATMHPWAKLSCVPLGSESFQSASLDLFRTDLRDLSDASVLGTGSLGQRTVVYVAQVSTR
jgi:hypothetical protein